MVTKQMRKDLFERAHKVLYVGDGAQLPPVGDSGFFHKATPDAVLVSIQRQAAENPILRLSQMIREGRDPSSYNHPGCRIARKMDVGKDAYLKCNQVLIGTNRGRHKVNRFFREHLWGPGYAQASLLMPGEKLLCKQNDVKTDPLLVNGNLFKVEASEPSAAWRRVTQKPYKPVDAPAESSLLSVWDSPDQVSYCEMFLGLLLHNYYEDLEYFDPFVMLDHNLRYRMGYLDFDYGYGITVHASQGSEWDSVIVCDDWAQSDRQRWLYTAVTRAKQELIWIK
jgi:exodeoxyribonuclease-5